MLRAFVKEIVVYNDKIDIYYNYIDAKRPDDLEHQAFSFYTETIQFDIKNTEKSIHPYIFELTVNLFI